MCPAGSILCPARRHAIALTMSILDRKLKLSINPRIINKNEAGDDAAYADGWTNVEFSPRELAASINDGVAYSCQLRGGRRAAANFLCCDLLSVDVDGTRRLEEVMADPIVQRHLTILYTTPSHTEDSHRFRLVFALPRTIDTASDMRAASRSLTLRLAGDRSATDPARLFFGSRGSEPQVFDRAIDDALLDELIAQGKAADQSDSIGGRPAPTRSSLVIPSDLHVMTATGAEAILPEVPVGTPVHCPFHHDEHASAFVTVSRIGTRGLHCSRCDQTFWPADGATDAHDFFDFDAEVRAVTDFARDLRRAPGSLTNDYGQRFQRYFDRCDVCFLNDEFVRIGAFANGVTFVKSPKGTGKTRALEELVASSESVLVNSHRVALVAQLCHRLGVAELPAVQGAALQGQARHLPRQPTPAQG